MEFTWWAHAASSRYCRRKERRHSRDSGAEEEFEVLEQEEIKEHRHSGDSGNCSEVEEGQNTNRAIELEFQLTQSLLSQVKAGENNRNANSGKQAQLDLERMDFVINGQTISKAYVHELYCQHNHLISVKMQITACLLSKFSQKCLNMLRQKLQMTIY